MKLKRIFACALALVFTASTIIARPASATDSEKNIDENQKIIYNKTNKKLTKSNGTCEKVYSDSTDEENAAEADYIFSMLMGEDVGPRREFIEKNATYANIDA